LAATLGALAILDVDVTGIVGVVDDGGSSGRLRDHLRVPPPGDLRMAMAALIPRDDQGELWRRVLQHRFNGTVDVGGHALGNLVIAALWSETGEIVAGLDALGTAVQARGRVLPNCLEPVVLVAEIEDPESHVVHTITGQSEISATRGLIANMFLEPSHPLPCPEAVTAIGSAEVIIFGPGSWYTSVLPHLLITEIREAIKASSAVKVLVLNLQPESGETEDFAPHTHLESWRSFARGISLDFVIADEKSVKDSVFSATDAGGIEESIHVADVSRAGVHDAAKLAQAFSSVMPKFFRSTT
jgi:uncharacterized cofD-like protein